MDFECVQFQKISSSLAESEQMHTSTGRCAWKNSGLMQLPVESTVQVQYSTVLVDINKS